jgi:hypothetical protein
LGLELTAVYTNSQRPTFRRGWCKRCLRLRCPVLDQILVAVPFIAIGVENEPEVLGSSPYSGSQHNHQRAVDHHRQKRGSKSGWIRSRTPQPALEGRGRRLGDAPLGTRHHSRVGACRLGGHEEQRDYDSPRRHINHSSVKHDQDQDRTDDGSVRAERQLARLPVDLAGLERVTRW